MSHRILIVDGDPDVTRDVSRALRQAGLEVLYAENGKRAMAILAEQSIDLVITDLVMPEMDGLEIICALRKSRPSLPIVVISGPFGGQFLKMAVTLGARAAFAKPLSMARLVGTVRQALGLDPPGAEPENPPTGL